MFTRKFHFSIVKTIVLTLGLVIPSYGQTTHDVTLSGGSFNPANLSIQLGDTVHWIWTSGTHSVESGTVVSGSGVHDGIFRSGDPGTGLIYDLTFDQSFIDANPVTNNEYPYYCFVHAFSGMVGQITVETSTVPAVSSWGLIILVMVLMIGGTLFLYQQKTNDTTFVKE